ncbi:MAG: S-layer homology domain-containing protein [Syntrophomonadaceae bacterium]
MKKTLTVMLSLLLLFTFSSTALAGPHVHGWEKNKVKKQVKEMYKAQKKNQSHKLAKVQFRDTDNHWAKGSINMMHLAGLFKGYPDGYFRPDDSITQAETIELLMRLIDDEYSNNIRDDKEYDKIPEWARLSCKKAALKGIINLNRFHSAVQAERAQAAVWIAKALGLEPVDTSDMPFSDWLLISKEDVGYILALYKEGIILGLPDGRFNPNSYITRAEMAVIIQRILDKIDEEEEEEEITGTISLPERVTLEQGERITLKATVKYSDGSDDYEITWTTSDKNVARVNQDGLVRAADDKTGVVYIKATATRDGKSISATCKVTVVEKDEIVSAQLERTGNMGIHDGKVYEEYRLEAGGDVISLDSDNVKRISLTKGDEEPVKLTPNSDSTLWFNVQKESATYTLRVQDMDDVIYEATLDWEGPEEVEATFTGREGINNGIQYREYQFEDLNLSDFTKMYQIKPDGTIVELTANSDVNLWFKISDQLTGEHIFLVLQDGQWYSATIEYED